MVRIPPESKWKPDPPPPRRAPIEKWVHKFAGYINHNSHSGWYFQPCVGWENLGAHRPLYFLEEDVTMLSHIKKMAEKSAKALKFKEYPKWTEEEFDLHFWGDEGYIEEKEKLIEEARFILMHAFNLKE